MTGWICPICNAGLAPHVSVCPNTHQPPVMIQPGTNPYPSPSIPLVTGIQVVY